MDDGSEEMTPELVTREANRIYREQVIDQVREGIALRAHGTYPDAEIAVEWDMKMQWLSIRVRVTAVDESTGKSRRAEASLRILEEDLLHFTSTTALWSEFVRMHSRRLVAHLDKSLQDNHLKYSQKSNIFKYKPVTGWANNVATSTGAFTNLGKAIGETTFEWSRLKEVAQEQVLERLSEESAIRSIKETIKKHADLEK